MDSNDNGLRHASQSLGIFQQAPDNGALRRPYRGQSHADRTNQRRMALIDAGIDVFGKLGLREATIREVCHQARVANRFFNEHFSSLEELFDVVYLHEKDLLTVSMQTAVFQVNKDGRTISETLLATFHRFFLADPRRARILLIDGPWRQASMATASLPAKHMIPSMQDIGMRWMAYLHAGYPPAERKKKLWRAFLCMTVQSAKEWALNGFDTTVDEQVQLNLDIWRLIPEARPCD